MGAACSPSLWQAAPGLCGLWPTSKELCPWHLSAVRSEWPQSHSSSLAGLQLYSEHVSEHVTEALRTQALLGGVSGLLSCLLTAS